MEPPSVEMCRALYCDQEVANHTMSGDGLCPWHFNEYARGRYYQLKPLHEPKPRPKSQPTTTNFKGR